MMKKWFVLILVITLCLSFVDCKKQPYPGRPNILLITIDTLRADYIGCYGSPDVKTPNIDALAASGIQFMHHVAPSQCTNPSHASILTGLYPTLHQVMDNRTALADEAISLVEILNKHGYYTLGAVSVHHLNPHVCHFEQGFDEFLNCQPVELNAEERNQELLKKLKSIPRFPFFVWVHYFDPHGPYLPPPPYDRMYPRRSKYEPVPPHNEMNLTKEQKSKPVDPDLIIPLYKAEITFLDSQIGILIQTLKKIRRCKNLLIILVADHGESMVEKNIYFCHAGMYNPVLHVPLIISFPPKLPQGLKITSLTSSVDIFPTVLRILDIPYQWDQIDGKSLFPTFSNPGYKVHPYIISEAYKGVIRVVYKDEYKFIKPFPTDWACKESHLFQSWRDYHESVELKTVNAEIAEELERLMGNWLKNAGKNMLGSKKRKKLDKKSEKALKTLGYLD